MFKRSLTLEYFHLDSLLLFELARLVVIRHRHCYPTAEISFVSRWEKLLNGFTLVFSGAEFGRKITSQDLGKLRSEVKVTEFNIM